MLECIVVTLMLFTSVAGDDYTPSESEYLLEPVIKLLTPLNWIPFDDPPSISGGETTPSLNQLPSVDDMMYYNYYAASMYYTYDLDDLSCEYCSKFKPDVAYYTTPNSTVHNTIALVARSDIRKEIVVAFRGTLNAWNLILGATLISGRVDSTSNIMIHRGFYILTMSIYDKVIRDIAFHLKDHPHYKVVLTGHSLGGCMARITYFRLEDLKQFPGVTYELYTYGEPRTGNKEFANFFNSKTIKSARVVARGDLFTHIPPTSVAGLKLLGDYYVHPQTEFWIDGKDGQKFCNQTVYEDPKCSNSMGPLYSVLDHFFYFDVNLSSIFAQPLLLATLPFNILDPATSIPALPKPIAVPIGGVLQTVGGILDGPLR